MGTVTTLFLPALAEALTHELVRVEGVTSAALGDAPNTVNVRINEADCTVSLSRRSDPHRTAVGEALEEVTALIAGPSGVPVERKYHAVVKDFSQLAPALAVHIGMALKDVAAA